MYFFFQINYIYPSPTPFNVKKNKKRFVGFLDLRDKWKVFVRPLFPLQQKSIKPLQQVSKKGPYADRPIYENPLPRPKRGLSPILIVIFVTSVPKYGGIYSYLWLLYWTTPFSSALPSFCQAFSLVSFPAWWPLLLIWSPRILRIWKFILPFRIVSPWINTSTDLSI